MLKKLFIPQTGEWEDMIQLENYLSRKGTHAIKNVLLLEKGEEIRKLIVYLAENMQVQKLWYAVPDTEDVSEDSMAAQTSIYRKDILTVCRIRDIPDIPDRIDTLIFGRGMKNIVQNIKGIKPENLLGKTDDTEDWFEMWETYRDTVSCIYIETTHGIVEWTSPKENIELSVIIPVYNVEKYLSHCIESLISWDADYVEFLCIDDGSMDGSAKILDAYASRDNRVKVIHKENGGCASARNRGLIEARGTYIGFVDADDFVDGSMYPKLLKSAMAGNYDLAYCGYLEYAEDTKAVCPAADDCLHEPYISGTHKVDDVRLLTVNTRVAIWRGIYKKEILHRSKIQFHEDLKRFDDLPFRVEYIFAAKSAICVPECLYYYRLGRDGQDISCADRRLYVHFAIFDHLDAFAAKYKDRRIWDLLQVVKIHTHGYALSRLDKALGKDYRRRARTQIRTHGGYFRNACLILMYAGKGSLIRFMRMRLL